MQQFLLLLNPLPVGLLLIGIGLYFGGKKSYWIEIIVSLIQSTWLFANTLYYREFSDFLSFGIIKSSSSVSNNLGLVF
jgi:Phosphoglycerol transferase and related proteins, alkaline phosphatase superfamily